MILPGWTCNSCDVFNGEAKEKQEECRNCAASRPLLITRDEARELALRIIDHKSRSYVEAALALAKFIENGTRIHTTFFVDPPKEKESGQSPKGDSQG